MDDQNFYRPLHGITFTCIFSYLHKPHPLQWNCCLSSSSNRLHTLQKYLPNTTSHLLHFSCTYKIYLINISLHVQNLIRRISFILSKACYDINVQKVHLHGHIFASYFRCTPIANPYPTHLKGVVLFNATFHNIWVISRRSVLLEEIKSGSEKSFVQPFYKYDCSNL